MSATDRRSDLSWVVHKFGGSSVADAQCFERVARIIESPAMLSSGGTPVAHARVAVVLSACKGVTDELLQLVALAERRDESWRARLAALRARHAGIAAALLDAARSVLSRSNSARYSAAEAASSNAAAIAA